MKLKRKSLVDLANEQVSILDVCRWVGMDIGTQFFGGRSTGKLYCPLGNINHDDGGVTRSFRIYPDTGSAWCFRCMIYFTPVSLAAIMWGRKQKEVAGELLDRIGYKTETVAERWAKARNAEDPPDVHMLAQALQLYCEGLVYNWKDLQFEPDVSRKLSRCFDLLDRVSTSEDADVWLSKSKIVMAGILTG